MNKILIAAFAAASINVSAAWGQAAPGDGFAYVVNGIAGRDIANNISPSFPIDVSVGSACIARNAIYGTATGPYTVPSGANAIVVHEANATPCSGAVLLTTSATIAVGQTISIIAHEGSNKAGTLNVLPIDLTAVPANSGRVIVVHAADAPTLDVVGFKPTTDQTNVTFSDIGLSGTTPGGVKTATLPAGTSFVGRLTPAGATAPVYGPPGAVGPRAVAIVYLIGSTTTGSAMMIGTLIPGVF